MFSSKSFLTEYPTGVCFGASESVTKNETNFWFENVHINGFEYGFKGMQYCCGGSGGINSSFSFCKYGIYIRSTAHLFNAKNFAFNNYAMGIRIPYGSPCSLTDVHLAVGLYNQQLSDEVEKPYGIHSKGGLVIDGIYYENYGNDANGYLQKFAVIDYEGAAVETPLIIKNVGITKPSGAGGFFLRASTYYGNGPESNAETPLTIDPRNKSYYPNGAVIMEDCALPRTGIYGLIVDKDNNPKTNLLGYEINNKKQHNEKIIISSRDCTIFSKYNTKLEFSAASFHFSNTNIDENTYFNKPNLKPCTYSNSQNHPLLDLGNSCLGLYNIKINGTITLDSDITSGIDLNLALLSRRDYKTLEDSEQNYYPIKSIITNGKKQIIDISFERQIFVSGNLEFGYLVNNNDLFLTPREQCNINYDLTFEAYYIVEMSGFVSSVEMSENDAILNVGESKIITATPLPKYVTNKTLTLNIIDSNIASITTDGFNCTIEGLTNGTTQLTCKAQTGSVSTINITVN